MTSSLPLDSTSHPLLCDCALSDLTPTTAQLLAAQPSDWFSSAQFSQFYMAPPADRVCVFLDRAGVPLHCCYYREDILAGGFRRLLLFGPVGLSPTDLHHLAAHRRAQVATISRMRRGDLPAPPGAWHRVATVRQSEDFIIDLPDSVEEYSAGLGRLARRNMSYYVRRLQRERGDSLHWVEAMGADIALEHYQQLVAMNRSRIESKGSRSLWDDSLARRRFALARETGLLFGMFFGKELVGGTLTYLHGDQAYLVLVAHDPTYERLNVGSACMWLTIRRLIHLKIKHCHLLWGAAFHKSQFGGQMQPLFEMSVFETPVAAVVWHGVRFGNALERARQALGRRGRRLVAKWRQRSIPESRVVS